MTKKGMFLVGFVGNLQKTFISYEYVDYYEDGSFPLRDNGRGLHLTTKQYKIYFHWLAY